MKFKIELNYNNSSSTYTAKSISTCATMFPEHTYSVGDVIIYSYKGNLNKDFRYIMEETGDFTFTVPDAYMPNPNFTLALSVQGPN